MRKADNAAHSEAHIVPTVYGGACHCGIFGDCQGRVAVVSLSDPEGQRWISHGSQAAVCLERETAGCGIFV